MTRDMIPFHIDTQRVIQLLANQIYQSPLALLRENTQNAFDAVKQRLYNQPDFDPLIEITLTPNKIIVSDNGVGMTPDELQQHYWKAGSSSKNNDDARAAGVVGTFGIGAMANFGIAESLTVETESAVSGERTVCRAVRTKLDLGQDCIERDILEPEGSPGTIVTAYTASNSSINVQKACDYIADFVSLVEIPVRVNGRIFSQKPVEELIPQVPESWRTSDSNQKIGPRMSADVTLILSNNADLWMHLTNIHWDSKHIPGKLVLRTDHSILRTYRSGFGLATASVNSLYQFGGIADLLTLEPTAGREAISVDGLQFLQSMMSEIDSFVSQELAEHNECDSSTQFMNWVVKNGKYDLCGKLRMTINPGDRISLNDVASLSSKKPFNLYRGNDPGIVKAHASEDTPILVLARTNPRRSCEIGFLQEKAEVLEISDSPTVNDRRTYNQMSPAESGLAFRIESILQTDYFVKCNVGFGFISHSLPVLVSKENGQIDITLSPESQNVQLLINVFQTEYDAFASMAKDFVRTMLFPRISDYVPSSTRQGAEAFLRAIQKPRELFEYEDADLGDLPSIWEDYTEGRISLDQAVTRSKSAVRSSVQFVESATSAKDVVPDVIENERSFNQEESSLRRLDPLPGITRLEITSAAKLLVIDSHEPDLRGYRCFLAVTDRTCEELGEFFLQPHTTSIVWGGQKTLFIFMHHSGQFGLYYDLQTRELVDAPAGGDVYPTCSIVLKDRIYIPIPNSIDTSFIPKAGERKRFEVRADILKAEGR